MLHTKTLKLRIKDKHAKTLNAMAREVNFVWNYVNELSSKATARARLKNESVFLTAFDLQKYTKGYSQCDGVLIGSSTVQQICEEFATRRRQFKKSKLRWRVSNPESAKRSLGWIPFKAGALVYRAGQVQFAGCRFSLWDSYGLAHYTFRSGSFNQDAQGKWYVNIVVRVEVATSPAKAVCGIDLGLKTAAVNSDGLAVDSRYYRAQEAALGVAQRAGKKARVKAIHAKIKNQRKDALHQYSRILVQRYGMIFVGNVSSQAMIKSNRAKSALDAGWSILKTMLEYKCHQAGIVFKEVNEAYSTQTCSCCGTRTGPSGLKGLGIREWTCSACGNTHDRDINAAKNILRSGMTV
jgi:IS605 OrfB family transposase